MKIREAIIVEGIYDRLRLILYVMPLWCRPADFQFSRTKKGYPISVLLLKKTALLF